MDGILTCPNCGYKQKMRIPENKCMLFYVCKNCGKQIKAKTCCVFCDYGNKKCSVKNGQMTKDFIVNFEKNVRNTIRKHNLLKKGEKVIVACSGGKDSTTVLYLLKKFGYNPEALIIDLHIGRYSKENLENLRQFCKEHKTKLHVVSIRDEFGCTPCYAKSLVNSNGSNLSSCSICGIMKRYILNKTARLLGADKIATGHNLDDEAQTALMNIFTGNLEAGMSAGPSTGAIRDDMFVQRIKPLFFIKESDVRKYSEIMGFPVIYDPCPCSLDSFRAFLREKLNSIEKNNPEIKKNILNSFLSIISELRDFEEREKVNACCFCGEPSRNETCSVCGLFQKIKQN